jgi:hydroxymethylpyrimidine pyrophosphatase-like HAD family hydrolase
VNFRPKLIATDLDGTIVTYNFGISKETIATFTKAHQLGVEIFFVTGRPPRWMVEISETFSFGNAICGNGAMLYDLRTGQVIEQWLIPVAAQIATVNRLREVIPQVAFAIENHDAFQREVTYIPMLWRPNGMDLMCFGSIALVIRLKRLVKNQTMKALRLVRYWK